MRDLDALLVEPQREFDRKMVEPQREFDRKMVEPQREFDRKMALSWLRQLGVAFRRSGKNPLFAWDAWRESRHFGLPLPDWAASVFDEWAAAFQKLARNPGTRATEDVFQALRLVGREADKSAFFRYHKWLRDRDYFESVAELLGSDLSLKVPTAVASVAKREGVSRQTVSRACEGMLEILRRESR
jgi:hypothetical protein